MQPRGVAQRCGPLFSHNEWVQHERAKLTSARWLFSFLPRLHGRSVETSKHRHMYHIYGLCFICHSQPITGASILFSTPMSRCFPKADRRDASLLNLPNHGRASESPCQVVFMPRHLSRKQRFFSVAFRERKRTNKATCHPTPLVSPEAREIH